MIIKKAKLCPSGKGNGELELTPKAVESQWLNMQEVYEPTVSLK